MEEDAEPEMEAKRRRPNDYAGDEPECDPVETRRLDSFGGGRIFNMVTVNGDVFPRFPVQASPEQHVRNIRAMSVREDDVIIASFPNSGARWIRELTQMLMAGHTEHDSRTKEHVTIELNNVADIEGLPSPRVLCSHLFLRQLSSDIVTKKSRVIHVMRNPKDLVVSYYFRSKQLSLFDDRGFQDFAHDFLYSSGCQGTCMDYFTYLHEMMRWQKENAEVPVMNVYYEDVYKNPAQCVQDLARFLQLSHMSDALCADVADQCAFHPLQDVHQDGKLQDHPSNILFRDYRPCFFRKGVVGDWKNHFTMALSEQFDAMLADRLHLYPVTFQYSIQ